MAMKLTLEQIREGDEEIIIRYKNRSRLVDDVICCIEGQEKKISAVKDKKTYLLRPQEIIYLESVDGSVYLYTKEDVYSTSMTLNALEYHYKPQGFFRCSKSMVINIYRISHLKSKPGNRIDAMMDNGEHVIISRRYASELRAVLKSGTTVHTC